MPRLPIAVYVAAATVGLALVDATLDAQVVTFPGLRAVAGVGYESFTKRDSAAEARNGEQRMLESVGIETSFALLDPRIFNVDLSGDLQFTRRTRQAGPSDVGVRQAFGNVRTDVTILSGRNAPLRVFYGRNASRHRVADPTVGDTVGPLRLWTEQSTKGLSWDLVAANRPLVHIASTWTRARNTSSGDAGQDVDNREHKLEARVSRDTGHTRYDASYQRDATRFAWPSQQLANDYSGDQLRLSAGSTLRDRVAVDGAVRYTAFRVGAARTTQVSGVGADANARITLSPRWVSATRYTMSSNLTELILSSGTALVGTPSSGRRAILFQDADQRVTYTSASGRFSVAGVGRLTSLGTPRDLPRGLRTLASGGLTISRTQPLAGFDITLSGMANAGQVTSNRGTRAPYRDASGTAQVSRRIGVATVSTHGSLGSIVSSIDYPVGGRSHSVGGSLDLSEWRWMAVRLAGQNSRTRRNALVFTSDDTYQQVSAGLSGPRYELNAEEQWTRAAAAGLLEPALLELPNPELLLATRPEVFGRLSGSDSHGRFVSGRLRLTSTLDVRVRYREERRAFGDTYRQQTSALQATASYAVRQLRIEAGYETLDLDASLGRVHDRRVFVNVLRDITLFGRR